MMDSIAILGTGAVGGLLAGLFERAGIETLCIVRDEQVQAYEASGLAIDSQQFGKFTAKPRFAPRLDVSPEVLFITTKFYDLASALQKIEPEQTNGRLVVPLLNGLDHMAVLRQSLPGAKVIAASVFVEAYRTGQSEIRHNSNRVKINLASDDSALKSDLENLAATLRACGIEVEIHQSEGFVLWRKIVQLNALALLTTATGFPFGKIRDNPELYEHLQNCVREGIAVAKTEAVTVEENEVFTALAKYHDDFRTSMSRDRDLGKRTELDAIAGAILQRGKQHGIACPTIEHYYQILKPA